MKWRASRRSYEKFGERFLKRILHPAEISYCLSHKAPGPFLAARFAAKEAISKAFGTGIGSQLGWHHMEVGRKPTGEPFVILHGNGEKLLKERNGRVVLISLQSHPGPRHGDSDSRGALEAFRRTAKSGWSVPCPVLQGSGQNGLKRDNAPCLQARRKGRNFYFSKLFWKDDLR